MIADEQFEVGIRAEDIVRAYACDAFDNILSLQLRIIKSKNIRVQAALNELTWRP